MDLPAPEIVVTSQGDLLIDTLLGAEEKTGLGAKCLGWKTKDSLRVLGQYPNSTVSLQTVGKDLALKSISGL